MPDTTAVAAVQIPAVGTYQLDPAASTVTFATGNPRRDQDVKSARLLHVGEHPQITFQSTELVQDGDAWRMRGQITARGKSAPAELTITEAAASDDVLRIRATTRVDRYAHGLTKA
jgi:polyisoprenoid-binding protein YceI